MQKVLRLWRTIRHLTFEQFAFRAINRGKRAVYRIAGGAFERHLRTRLAELPSPDWDSVELRRLGELLHTIQADKYADQLPAIRAGTFTLLNRTVEFGGLDALEWRRDLGEGNNPLWRMNLSYMGYAVPLLATGDARDLTAVESLLRSLEDQNRWTLPGVFRDVWFSYSVSHRIINLLAGVACWLRKSGDPSPPALQTITEHLKLCVQFLRRNLERELQFNHLLKNLVALKCYESALAPSHDCKLVDEKFLVSNVLQQMLADGGHVERSPMYHALFVQDLQLLTSLRWRDQTALRTLQGAQRRALVALDCMSHVGSNRLALMNDAWLGESLPPAQLLKQASIPAPSSVQTLRDTGYTRISHEGLSLILDCGPAGPDNNLGHAHADFLTVEVMHRGVPLIVDPGTPIYTAGALRDWCRSAAIHNGPAIEGEEPLEFWKSFRVGRRGYGYPLDTSSVHWNTSCIAAGYQTGYKHVGCIVGRFIEATSPDDFLILDVWHSRNDASRPMTTWLVSDAWEATAAGAQCVLVRRGTSTLEWSFAGADTLEVGESDYFEEFGVAKRATKITVRPKNSGNWYWLAAMVRAADRADSGTAPDLHRALEWMQARLTERGALARG